MEITGLALYKPCGLERAVARNNIKFMFTFIQAIHIL